LNEHRSRETLIDLRKKLHPLGDIDWIKHKTAEFLNELSASIYDVFFIALE
jgi:hypothetical protein